MSEQNYKDLMSLMTIISVHKFIKQQSKLKYKFTNTVCHYACRVQKPISKIIHAFKVPIKTVEKITGTGKH